MERKLLSPWEELAEFDAPVATVQTTTPGKGQIVGANPNRVVLILADRGASLNVIQPGPVTTTGAGLWIPTTLPILTLTHKDHPTLPQSAWFNALNVSGSFDTVELILREGAIRHHLSPWEELGYYQLPIFTVHPSVPALGQIVGPNPMRVVLIISGPSGGTGNVFPTGNITAGAGMILSAGLPNLTLTHKDHPGLPESAWFNTATTAMTYSTIEVLIREEPPGAML